MRSCKAGSGVCICRWLPSPKQRVRLPERLLSRYVGHYYTMRQVPLFTAMRVFQAADVLVNTVLPSLPDTAVDQRTAVVVLLLDALLTCGPREVKLAQQVAAIAATSAHPLLHGMWTNSTCCQVSSTQSLSFASTICHFCEQSCCCFHYQPTLCPVE